MIEAFSKYLENIEGLNASFVDEFVNGGKVSNISKGTFLVREGDYSNNLYWVSKGLLVRYFIDTQGRKQVVQFAPENWWVSARRSSYDEPSSKHFVECLKDAEVIAFSFDYVQEKCDKYPAFNKFNNQLLQNHISNLIKRIIMLQSSSAEERYLCFVKYYPELVQKTSLRLIASYLGITPESISRIRKELRTNKK